MAAPGQGGWPAETVDHGADRSLDRDEQGQESGAVPPRRDQEGDGKGDGAGEQIPGDESRSPGDAVGESAPDRREQSDRQEGSRGDHHRPGGLSGVRDDQCPTATVCIQEPMTETMPPDHNRK